MSKGSTAAPDYKGAAEATAAGNAAALAQQTAANRPNQYTPFGNSVWSNTPTFDQSGYDRAMADWQAGNSKGTWVDGTQGSYSVQGDNDVWTPGTEGHWTGATSNGAKAPTRDQFTTDSWSQNITLTPAEQASLEAQQKVQLNQSNLAAAMQGQVANTMANGFNAPKMSDYLGGVPGVQTGYAGFNPTGVAGVDQRTYNPMQFLGGTLGVNQTFNGNAPVNTNFSGGPAQNLNAQGAVAGAGPVNANFSGGPAQNLNAQGAVAGAGPVNTNFSGGPAQNLNAAGAVAGAGNVDLNAPQFSDANAKAGAEAAYRASTGLLQDGWDQAQKKLDVSLRLQGLQPGTEGYNNAVQNQQRVLAQQQNNLADMSVRSGNDMANQNYQSILAGYGAGLGAQNQAYNQGANTFAMGNNALNTEAQRQANAFSLNNAAQGQAYNQGANTFTMGNDARNTEAQRQASIFGLNNAAQGQAYNQGANTFTMGNDARNTEAQRQANAFSLNNAAQGQQFGQNATGFGLTNDARTQALNNNLGVFNSMLAGQAAGNAAQGQAYGQAANTYGMNTDAQRLSNEAQQQAYQQAMQNFQTAYGTDYQNYMQPLNSMNAVLAGNQVQMPEIPGFATAGYAAGPDYSGAASSTGQWNSGQAAQKTAQTGQLLGTAATVAAAFI